MDSVAFLSMKDNLENFIHCYIAMKHREYTSTYEYNVTVHNMHAIISSWEPEVRQKLRRISRDLLYEQEDDLIDVIIANLSEDLITEQQMLTTFYMIAYLSKMYCDAGKKGKIGDIITKTERRLNKSKHCVRRGTIANNTIFALTLLFLVIASWIVLI